MSVLAASKQDELKKVAAGVRGVRGQGPRQRAASIVGRKLRQIVATCGLNIGGVDILVVASASQSGQDRRPEAGRTSSDVMDANVTQSWLMAARRRPADAQPRPGRQVILTSSAAGCSAIRPATAPLRVEVGSDGITKASVRMGPTPASP